MIFRVSLVFLAVFSVSLAFGHGIYEHSPCASRIKPSVMHERFHAVLWIQSSPEYEMCCEQIFISAKKQLLQAVDDKSWTAATEQKAPFPRPMAVIVDVDETVLDNSPAEAHQVIRGTTPEMGGFNPQDFGDWVEMAKARPLPGAKDFIAFVRQQGVKVFYVTNRERKEATFKNIKKSLDIKVSRDELIMKDPVHGYEKTHRRAKIAKTHRILLLLGDDYNDFVSLGDKYAPVKRKEIARKYKEYWGERWFILPNPLYGSFEKAAKKHPVENPASAIERLRIQSLARKRKLKLSENELEALRKKRATYLNKKASHLRPMLLPRR